MLRQALTRLWITAAAIHVMGLALIAIAGVHLLARLRKPGAGAPAPASGAGDPFHDSRRHPLNSPEAARG